MLLSIAWKANRCAGSVMSKCPGELLKFSMRSGVLIKNLSSFDER